MPHIFHCLHWSHAGVHTICLLQEYLSDDVTILTDTGDAQFNAMKLKLPEKTGYVLRAVRLASAYIAEHVALLYLNHAPHPPEAIHVHIQAKPTHCAKHVSQLGHSMHSLPNSDPAPAPFHQPLSPKPSRFLQFGVQCYCPSAAAVLNDTDL